MQKLSVSIPDDLRHLLYERVPKGKRAGFVSNAIAEALAKQERLAAFQELEEFEPFDVERDSVEVLREVREERNAHMENLK